METVLITGANRGIGLALCRQYKIMGRKVIGTCREASPALKDLEIEIIENVDITSLDRLKEVESMIPKLDLLINNAGIMSPDTIDSIDYEKMREQFEVNTLGTLKVAQTLGNKLSEGGTFGIVTSRMGSIADNSSGRQYGYRTSKSGANAVGRSLSQDWKERGVIVLLLHPGYVRTDMTGGRGLIDPEQSARGLVEIIDSKNIQQTGTFWHTNGEKLLW